MVNFWKNLNPTHKRWLIVTTVGGLILFSLYYAVKDDTPQELPKANSNQSQLKILATNKLDDFTLASLSNTIDSLKQQLNKQIEQQKQLQQQIATLQHSQQQTQTQLKQTQTQSPTDKASSKKEDFDNRQYILDLLAGLKPDAQKQVYYSYIKEHPDRRDKDLEKLIGYDFLTYHPPINQELTAGTNSASSSTNPNTKTSTNLSANPNTQSNLASASTNTNTNNTNKTSNTNSSTNTNSSNTLSNGNDNGLKPIVTNDPLKSFASDSNQTIPPVNSELPAVQTPNTQWQNQVLYGNPPQTYTNTDHTITPQNSNLNQQLSSAQTTAAPLTIISISSTQVIPQNSLEIPLGSLFTGVMVTGLDAPTNDGAKADPYPVLVKLRSLDFLPNNYATDLDSCFVMLSSYGDISSSRALMRTQSLSCITKDKYILEGPLKGYVVGADGKIGVEGRLVSKQGSLILKTISISMLQSLAGILNKPNLILGSSDKNVDISTVLKQSGLNGAGDALNKVASFYLALANKMFPLIEVPAGTSIDIVLTAPVTLQLTNRKVSSKPLLELTPPNKAKSSAALSLPRS